MSLRRMRSARPSRRRHSARLAEAARLETRHRPAIRPGQLRPEFPRLALPVVVAQPLLPVPKPFRLGPDAQPMVAERPLRRLRKRVLAGLSPTRHVNLVPATAAEARPLGRRDFPDCAPNPAPKEEAPPRANRVPAGFDAHPSRPDPRAGLPQPAAIRRVDGRGHSRPAEEPPLHPNPSARPAHARWLTAEPKASPDSTTPGSAAAHLPPASNLEAPPASACPGVRRQPAWLPNRALARQSAPSIAAWFFERCCAREATASKANSTALPQPGRSVAHVAVAGLPSPATEPIPRRSRQNARAAIPGKTSTASW